MTSPLLASMPSSPAAPMRLNDAQQAAVKVTGQHVLVLAGAGSGKTRVITAKVCHLIKNLQVNAQQLLAVTFTNKAAGEMRQRVTQLLGHQHGRVEPSILTFHAFWGKIS